MTLAIILYFLGMPMAYSIGIEEPALKGFDLVFWCLSWPALSIIYICVALFTNILLK